jgi:hypothetical protein
LILLFVLKVHLVVAYPYESVWPSAVRFVRVDHGWKILEQDKDAGFLRFELYEDKKPHAASLELVRVTDGEGRSAVRIQLQTADLPRFQEAPILDALARKLRDELGPPAAPAKKVEPPPDSNPK